jgi:hypothetical protein
MWNITLSSLWVYLNLSTARVKSCFHKMRLTLRFKCLNKVSTEGRYSQNHWTRTRTNLMALRPRGNFTLGWSTMTSFSSKKKIKNKNKNKWQFAACNIATYPGQIHLERSVPLVLPLWIFAFSVNHVLMCSFLWWYNETEICRNIVKPKGSNKVNMR